MAEKTFYNTTVPTIRSILVTLKAVLTDGKAFAQDKDEKELVNARLIDDMLPLHTQVDIVLAYLSFVLVQVGKVDPSPRVSEPVSTFDELITVVDGALKLVDEMKEDVYNANEDKSVDVRTLSKCSRIVHPRAIGYVTEMFIPNSFFHLNMTYAILRARGVPLGKNLYISPFFGPEVGNAWMNRTTVTPDES